jgi:hypothetical protein
VAATVIAVSVRNFMAFAVPTPRITTIAIARHRAPKSSDDACDRAALLQRRSCRLRGRAQYGPSVREETAPEPGLGEFGGHATTVCTKGPTKPGNHTYCLIRDIPDTMLYG